ncbi:MAG: hypothetical protein ACRCTT_21115 [Enterobacter roggenkampii]
MKLKIQLKILVAVISMTAVAYQGIIFYRVRANPIDCTGKVLFTSGENSANVIMSVFFNKNKGYISIEGALNNNPLNRNIEVSYEDHKGVMKITSNKIIKKKQDNASDAAFSDIFPSAYTTPGHVYYIKVSRVAQNRVIFESMTTPYFLCQSKQ